MKIRKNIHEVRMQNKIFLAIFMLLGFFAIGQKAQAVVTFPYSQNFDSLAESTEINGVGDFLPNFRSLTGSCSDGQKTTATSAAAMGGSGKGIRWWAGGKDVGYGPGKNDVSGFITLYDLPASGPAEIWVRVYLRFKPGFTWSSQYELKTIWLSTQTQLNNLIYGLSRDTCWGDGADRYDALSWWNQTSASELVCGPANTGWEAIQNGSTGDGQWHSYEIHVKKQTSGSNGVEEVWIDGVKKMSRSDLSLGTGGWPLKEIKFLVNIDALPDIGCQYIDLDNVAVSSTGYIGPISGGGDTTAPSVAISTTNPSTISTNSLSIAGTSTDAVGVTACKYRIGSAPDATNGTTITGTTSWSGTATGFSVGANTLYIGCTDTAGNWGTSSITVNYNAPVNGTCGSASGQSFVSLNSASANLCSSGTVANFAGSGPWTWGCNGSNGGTNTSAIACSANLSSSTATLLFSEDFDNSSFSSRGWYDASPTPLATSGCYSGAGCAKFDFAQGATSPTQMSVGALRKKFTPTDDLYISYYVNFANGWRGSQQLYHPHLIFLLSDLDSDYAGMANAYLDTYLEFLSDQGSPYTIRPMLAIQDAMRVNYSLGTPPVNISSTTENRSAGYCNSPLSAGATGDCYTTGGNYWWSSASWKNASAAVSTGVWHHVETYLHMNSISASKGQYDGIMQEWIDGINVIDHSDVLYRTNQDATKKWAQFALSPYIGDGSPIAQTISYDNLEVYNGNPNSTASPVTYSILNFTDLVASWLQIGTVSDLNADKIVNTRDLGVMMSKWN